MLLRILLAGLLVAPGCSAMASKGVLASAKRIELTARPVAVALSAPKLAEALRSHRLFLVVRGLRAAEAPGVLYNVYLDGSQHVGVINFYNARADSDPNAIIYSFDVTAAARALRGREKLTVTIVPSGEPAAAAHPLISRIELRAD
jgi:hypothetical protein